MVALIGSLEPSSIVMIGIVTVLTGGAVAFLEGIGLALLLRGEQPGVRRVAPLMAVHTASDVWAKILPVGAIASDATRASLLRAFLGVPVVRGAAGAVARRWHTGIAQGVFVFAAGLAALVPLTETRIPEAMIIAACATGMILVGALSLTGLLSHLPGRWRRLPSWFRRLAGSTSASLHESLRAPAHLLRVCGLFVVVWLVDAAETYLLLRILAIPVDPVTALMIEALVSSARLLAFFLPAGLGAQEAGYAGALTTLGLLAQLGDAGPFLVVKRAREGLLIACGLALLAVTGLRTGWQKVAPTFRKTTS